MMTNVQSAGFGSNSGKLFRLPGTTRSAAHAAEVYFRDTTTIRRRCWCRGRGSSGWSAYRIKQLLQPFFFVVCFAMQPAASAAATTIEHASHYQACLEDIPRCTSLTLKNRGLVGTVPTELGLLLNVTYLDLSSNNLTGTVPTELGMLSELDTLYIFHNSLTGTLPTELGMLLELEMRVDDLEFEAVGNGSTKLNSIPYEPLPLPDTFLAGVLDCHLHHVSRIARRAISVQE
ncbi:hypothetical protein CYMTET_4828 [Cymbomonas tetramitiformis]|uniref:Uncharacterized protein n=1 Tax=Cymbomonas tetramitiformis TaxID=36881 RepID=A0AAE0H2A7_9CHLO|nr:hypothetical protein CYMTET_4828 [Cymbomonas tetramitiformis]